MTRLDAPPEIVGLAAELGVGAAAPVDGILDFCRRRIDVWVYWECPEPREPFTTTMTLAFCV